MAPSPSARRPDRGATEAALQKAALSLLERDGLLAGLNLRAVADEAGVNRGLVYHYFGSRRDLLRAALRADVGARMADFGPGKRLPATARYAGFLRTALRHRQAVVLAMLLILDGDAGVRMVPDPAGTRERIGRDVDAGHLPPDVDPDGLHAALAALVYGYVVMRDHLADELEVDAEALDTRVEATIERLVGGLGAGPGQPPTGAGRGSGVEPEG